MLFLGLGLFLGSGLMLYTFFNNPGRRIPGATAFESADFPKVGSLIEGIAMFAFGAFLFALGLGGVLAGRAGF
jgi:hypothetical protein